MEDENVAPEGAVPQVQIKNTIEAVIIRADGSRENLGVIASGTTEE